MGLFKTIVNSKVLFDPDAQNFINVAGITNEQEKYAITTLALDLKKNNLWNKMFALYPFVGGSSSSNSYNLIDTSKYQITWSTGVTFDAKGPIGNGTSGYGDTGIVLSTINATTGITTSLSFSVYTQTTSASNNADFGITTVGDIFGVAIYCRRNDNNSILTNYRSDNGQVSFFNSAAAGLFLSSRTAINEMKGYINGSQQATATGTQSGLSNINQSIWVLGLKGPTSGLTSYSSRQLSMAHVGTGISVSEQDTFWYIVYNYQKKLNREWP